MSPNMMSNNSNNNQRNNVSRRGFYSGPRRAPANRSGAAQGPIAPAPPVAPTKSAKQIRSEETLGEVSRALSETNTVRRRALHGTENNSATYTIEFVTLQQLQARDLTENARHGLARSARFLDISKDAGKLPVHAQNEQMTEVKGDVEVFVYNLESVRRLVCRCGSVSAVPCVDEVDEIVGRLMSLRAPGNHDDGDRHKTGMTSAEAIAHAAADKLHSALSMVKGTGAMGRCECNVTAKATAGAAAKKTKGVSGGKTVVEAIGVVSVSPFVWADEMDQLEGEDVLNMDFSQPLFTLSPRH